MQLLLAFVIIQSLSSIESLQYTFLEATAPAHHSEAACATLPPTFSALLSDSCMEAKQELPTLPIKHDFRMPPSSNYGCMQYTYPKGCMTGSSFNDMLSKLKMVTWNWEETYHSECYWFCHNRKFRGYLAGHFM
ncbi:PREDICTED: uncharacterized protein LOC105140874 isoform X1 [Populus euphratica]|uniref:Uncharacterized protein LOC105140874 isoform X1 n=1 Tax=Populus euphratica TaxID=75702 RepID=A0AAJ6VE45_POPEU|nr:PREDICTED: uncharacterized protein LOC105140874 isoform X1 [Populus euphratica]